MKEHRFLLLVWMGMCASVFAETWTLWDAETGESYGPISPSNGAVVLVGDRTLTLQVSQTARDKTLARLKRIIIPALEFRQANLKDVLNFMVEASIAADPVKEGVNVVFKERRLEDGVEPRPASPGTRLADRSEPEDEWGIIGEAGECPPVSKGNVTMNLRRISLYDAMETVAEVAGVKWRITDGGVVFVEDTHPTEEDSLENN